jgi:hypothetical protein
MIVNFRIHEINWDAYKLKKKNTNQLAHNKEPFLVVCLSYSNYYLTAYSIHEMPIVLGVGLDLKKISWDVGRMVGVCCFWTYWWVCGFWRYSWLARSCVLPWSGEGILPAICGAVVVLGGYSFNHLLSCCCFLKLCDSFYWRIREVEI